MTIENSKHLLDLVISKARVHLYKPIQIAEILYKHRQGFIYDLNDLNQYRTSSRKWRDLVCMRFLGRISTSSAKYQDDIFNALPPEAIAKLGEENVKKNGIVESYIYDRFKERYSQMSSSLNYCTENEVEDWRLEEFLELFWNEPGLRRSIDKIYEIIVYSLFSALVEALEVEVSVSYNPEKNYFLNEFKDFADKVLLLSEEESNYTLRARINRVGVTNAADRGLDMWANFGLAIQIKHLSLTEEMAENIVNSVSSDRIVIVCKSSESKLIVSLLTQIGWKSKIQSIVTEDDLIEWYEKAFRGKYSNEIGEKVLSNIVEQIQLEFPTSENTEFNEFYANRKYDELDDEFWK